MDPEESGNQKTASTRPPMDVFPPRRRGSDFIRLAQRAAQPLRVPKRELDVAIDRAFFEKDDDFAIRALPRIAALQAPRTVAKPVLATRALDLNVMHFENRLKDVCSMDPNI